MPEIGEIKSAGEIGYKSKGYKYVWQACSDCGKERWVILDKQGPRHSRCRACFPKTARMREIQRRPKPKRRGEKSPFWKGGRILTCEGYTRVKLLGEDLFFDPMADGNGYVLEHRLVMAKHLGRNLHSWEIVHHRNHIRSDNRIENLQLVSDDRHKQISILESKITRLETEIGKLKRGRL